MPQPDRPSGQAGWPSRHRREPVMPDQNRFLNGPFAPVAEEITAFDLPVTGTLPAGLNGCYLRNGPNPLSLDDPGYRFTEGHWFLGPGMVHGVRLRDGRAEWYRDRCVRSRQLAEAMDEKWPAGPVHNDMDFAANTHIIAHAGRYLATVEAGPLPYELSGQLDTIGPSSPPWPRSIVTRRPRRWPPTPTCGGRSSHEPDRGPHLLRTGTLPTSSSPTATAITGSPPGCWPSGSAPASSPRRARSRRCTAAWPRGRCCGTRCTRG